jgi:hypothetical protein
MFLYSVFPPALLCLHERLIFISFFLITKYAKRTRKIFFQHIFPIFLHFSRYCSHEYIVIFLFYLFEDYQNILKLE